MAACFKRRAACGASYNARASGATPRKFETRQPARPAGKRGRTVNFNAELARPFAPLSTKIFWYSVRCDGFDVWNLCQNRFEFASACTFGPCVEVLLRH